MKWVFWVSLALIAYTYAGYPLWLYLRSRLRARPVRKASICPLVSIVLAAHNEAEALPGKLRNLAELRYPPDRHEVIVVSDGSSDATNQILNAKSNAHLRVVLLPQREGKAAALNRGIQEARGEIVVFADVRQRIEPEAVSHLVANFADPSVGCVTGELMLAEPQAVSADGVGLYWRMEKKIRQWESVGGSVVGATGALYAARKALLAPFPAGALLDDVYLPLQVVRLGWRVIFEPRARAWDNAPHVFRAEFRRKVRTLTGNYQLLQLAPWLLTRENPVRFEFVSHKLLRLLAPFALAGVLVGSIFVPGALHEWVLALQLLFYGSTLLVLSGLKLGAANRLGSAAVAFVVLNAAATVALFCFLTGKKDLWVRVNTPTTARAVASSAQAESAGKRGTL